MSKLIKAVFFPTVLGAILAALVVGFQPPPISPDTHPSTSDPRAPRSDDLDSKLGRNKDDNERAAATDSGPRTERAGAGQALSWPSDMENRIWHYLAQAPIAINNVLLVHCGRIACEVQVILAGDTPDSRADGKALVDLPLHFFLQGVQFRQAGTSVMETSPGVFVRTARLSLEPPPPPPPARMRAILEFHEERVEELREEAYDAQGLPIADRVAELKQAIAAYEAQAELAQATYPKLMME